MLTNDSPADATTATGDRAASWRRVRRAVADLRGGEAVVLRAEASLAVVALETADATRATALRAWGGVEPWLLRPDAAGVARSQAMDGAPARLWSDRGAVAPAGLPAAGAPADDALALARLARLLPALAAVTLDAAGLVRAREAEATMLAPGDVTDFHRAGSRLVKVAEAAIPLEDAAAGRLIALRNPASGTEHLAVVVGQPGVGDTPDRPAPLVRLHSECFTGDVLGSLRCDCGPQLRMALRRMVAEGGGVLLYLAQEGRGIGLVNKLRAYALQDRGLDTLDANTALGYAPDERDFAVAASALQVMGLRRVRLMTNNPAKVAALAQAGLVVERASLLVAANGVNDDYLATKATRFGHLLG